MNQYFKSSLAFVLMAIITIAEAQQPQQTKPVQARKGRLAKADVQSEFKSLISKYYAAWNTMKPENAAIYYAKEADLVFYDFAPVQYKGWQAYKSGVENLFANYQTFRLIPNNDLVVNHRGRVVWTTLTLRFVGKDKQGTAMELDARHTAIWERRAGKWLIVHEHVSVPLPESPPVEKK